MNLQNATISADRGSNPSQPSLTIFLSSGKNGWDLHKHRIICDYHTTYDVVVDGLSTSRLAASTAPSLSTCCLDLGKMCQQLVGTFGFSAPLSCESSRISGRRVGNLGNALAYRCMDALRRFPHLATPPVASGKWRLMQLSLTHTHTQSRKL